MPERTVTGATISIGPIVRATQVVVEAAFTVGSTGATYRATQVAVEAAFTVGSTGATYRATQVAVEVGYQPPPTIPMRGRFPSAQPTASQFRVF